MNYNFKYLQRGSGGKYVAAEKEMMIWLLWKRIMQCSDAEEVKKSKNWYAVLFS